VLAKSPSFFEEFLRTALALFEELVILGGMMTATQVLPNDLTACQALIIEQSKKINTQSHLMIEQARAILALQQENQEQQLTINELLQRAFYKRSERYLEDPNQLKLDFGSSPEAAAAAEGLAEAIAESAQIIAEHKRRVRKPRKACNDSLPAHLPRREVTLSVSEETKHCAQHGARKPIGFDRQETLSSSGPSLKCSSRSFPSMLAKAMPSAA
jgi:histone H3/H4